MIPKKIHYCWLSKDPLPEKIEKCIASWKRFLPDYEIIRWDLKRFPLDKSDWVRQAFELKKYAFAADYIRLYALATEGGIYLDSDVEVLKSYNDLLHLPYFICKENSPQGIEAATIGTEKGCFWILKCLEYYQNRSFVDEKGNLQTTVLPAILKSVIEKNFELSAVEKISDFIDNGKTVCYFPFDFFSPKNYVTKKLTVSDRTYSIHHFAGTWIPVWKKILLLAWVPFSVKFPKLASFIKRKK